MLVAADEGTSIKIDQIAKWWGRRRTGVRRPVPRGGDRRRDLMGDDAQNALLKTLEEPPARNVFVLVTARPICCS